MTRKKSDQQDFRQKHIAWGGEGAPLVMLGDVILFSKEGEERLMLNIGGIANFTYLPGSRRAVGAFATDTGPGNTLLDAYSRELFNKPYDEGGNFAKSGTINFSLLHRLKMHKFFSQKLPKTTGPELFSTGYVQSALRMSECENISPFDLMATLTRFTAETVAESIKIGIPLVAACCTENEETRVKVVFMSGGGSHNGHLVAQLKELLSEFTFQEMNSLGISADSKEAVLFATLANEHLSKGRNTYGEDNPFLNVSLGKISFPF